MQETVNLSELRERLEDIQLAFLEEGHNFTTPSFDYLQQTGAAILESGKVLKLSKFENGATVISSFEPNFPIENLINGHSNDTKPL